MFWADVIAVLWQHIRV